jgi:3-oxoadipate enol-lactonase
MPSAKVNGISLYYELAGSGNAVVFIHGFLGRGKSWKYQIEQLSRNYRVIAPDMRGHGKTDKPSLPEEYSIESLSSDLSEMLSHLKIKKCCMVGHSLGGIITSHFAARHPEMLAGVVLIASSGEEPKDAFSTETWKRLDAVYREKGWVDAFLSTLESDPEVAIFHNNEPEKIKKMQSLLATPDSWKYTAAWEAIASAPSKIQVLADLELPVLLICGENDLPNIVSNSVNAHWILPGSSHLLLKGIRHFPQDDASDIVNERIEEFLESLKW